MSEKRGEDLEVIDLDEENALKLKNVEKNKKSSSKELHLQAVKRQRSGMKKEDPFVL